MQKYTHKIYKKIKFLIYNNRVNKQKYEQKGIDSQDTQWPMPEDNELWVRDRFGTIYSANCH